MLLSSDTPPPGTIGVGFRDLLTIFGIVDATSTSNVSDFVEAVGLNALKATLHNPFVGGKLPEQPNALWCITTNDA